MSEKAALCLMVLVPMLCAAQPRPEASPSASTRLRFAVVVPPVFRVLQATPTKDGWDYRVWTNMKSVVLNGREFRFDKVGESTLRMPAAPGAAVVVHGL